MSRLAFVGALLLATFAAAGAWVAWRNSDDDAAPASHGPAAALRTDAESVARGAYLARIGDCEGCHTARGGARLAGGRPVETPFGVVYAPNLTPDATGLAAWSAEDFWRALHLGRSRSGRWLSPAFPYPSFTRVTRADSDALYDYLRTVAPVHAPARAHALAFPFGTQWALAAWRALYFRPGVFQPSEGRTPAWNRGAYLVEGLGHCAACHAPRDLLGGTRHEAAMPGAPLPGQPWVAPSLGGLASAAAQQDVERLLRTGWSDRGTALGPMADVVFWSTQYLRPDDAGAIAAYLSSLPDSTAPRPAAGADADLLAAGMRLYARDCADCHGTSGEGRAGEVPALAGNLTVALPSPVNLVHAIRLGGFSPVTPGHPRPFGMPPFGQVMNDREVAAVATYVRASWGGRGEGVSELDVRRTH